MTPRTAGALTALLDPIRDELHGVEEEIARMTAASSPALAALLEHVGQFRGKRLRPALTLLVGRLCGGVRPAHRTVGAIVELIHTATLVHDDILDESSMRRNIPTVNKERGNETAVLLGDYLFATCFREAASLEDRFHSHYLSDIVATVCRGEILQVHHRRDFDLDEQTYFTIIEEKTAALYAAALHCGARISGASAAEGAAATAYGRKLGCAFQIIDDILDLTGEEAKVGKSLGTDLEKAKMTLPLLRLRDRARPDDRARLEEIIREGGAEERRTIRPLLEEYGALASARATAEQLVEEACDELARLPDGPERALLEQAAGFVLARDR